MRVLLLKKSTLGKPQSWIASLGIYLVLVWGFALIRSNYLWITGDDPNLLIQAGLTSRGMKPNLDFTSGYPGLSQYTQAFLIKVFGMNIFSQHLYTAILASFTGLLVAINFKNIKPWILSTSLIVIYSQQHLVNPTPNPGHLFEVICLLMYTFLSRSKFSGKKSIAIASALLGVAFLAKQYSIFLLAGYLISVIARVRWKKYRTLRIPLILILGCAISVGYFLTLIPNSTDKNLILMNLIIMTTPYVFWIAMMRSQNMESIELDLRSAIGRCLGVSSVFIFTIGIGLCIMYRTTSVIDIGYKILIEAPRSINSNLVLINISSQSLIATASLFGFLSCLYLMNAIENENKFNKYINFLATLALILFTIAFFAKLGNLSSNIMLAIYPMMIMYLYARRVLLIGVESLSFFFVLSVYLFALIPYPNINFHIAILTIATLILLQDVFPKISRPGKKVSLVLPLLLTLALLAHEHDSIENMQSYRFGDLKFKSSSQSWEKSILEARKNGIDFQSCADMGCQLLLLITTHKSSSDNAIAK